jgi:hypothetical protein
MNDKPQDYADGAGKRRRGPERRASKLMTPPPYETYNGIVTVDRRSAVDRRATWIREFSLETFPDSEP